MTLNKRLDKIERSLTPKQAVILWLQEIQQYRNAVEYAQFLRGQPESARPLYKITKQISQTIRDINERPTAASCGKCSASGRKRCLFSDQTPTPGKWLSDDGRESLVYRLCLPGK